MGRLKSKRMKFIICVCLLLGGYRLAAQSVRLIPWPVSIDVSEEKFELRRGNIYCSEEVLLSEAEFLKKKLEETGLPGRIEKRLNQRCNIVLQLDEQCRTEEEYRLRMTPDRLTVSGKTPVAIFYGIQTLLQLLENGERLKGGIAGPCCQIEDYPRYRWRGFMLDESRHFFGKEKVKQLLDLMAYYKLNKFHWHLTDEPGWRIEIEKYPRLTSVGGKGNWSNPQDTVARFYTRGEIKEIVAYAAERHIEIVPEVDMPGHATAANKAYPQYSGGGTPTHPDFTFHPGKRTYILF